MGHVCDTGSPLRLTCFCSHSKDASGLRILCFFWVKFYIFGGLVPELANLLGRNPQKHDHLYWSIDYYQN